MKKVLKLVLKIMIFLEYSIIAVLILTTVAPRLFNFEPRIVESQSMAPNYNVNDIVYIDTNENYKNIKIGDVVATQIEDKMIIHRVIEKNDEKKTYQTKGDANPTKDASVIKEQYRGKVKYHIPHIGEYINLFKNVGFLLLVGGLIIFQNILITWLHNSQKGEKENE